MNAGQGKRAREFLLAETGGLACSNPAAWALLARTAHTPFQEIYFLKQLLRIKPGVHWATARLQELLRASTPPARPGYREPAPETDVSLPPRFRTEAASLSQYELMELQPADRRLEGTIHRVMSAGLALALVASLALFLVSKALGSGLYVVLSQSMEPAVPMGAVVVSQAVAPPEIEEGDVITFTDNAGSGQLSLTTHRVVRVTQQGNHLALETKGDAASSADIHPVLDPTVVGRVWLVVPLIGFALAFIRTPLGFALVVGLPALIIIVGELKTVAEIVRERSESSACAAAESPASTA